SDNSAESVCVVEKARRGAGGVISHFNKTRGFSYNLRVCCKLYVFQIVLLRLTTVGTQFQRRHTAPTRKCGVNTDKLKIGVNQRFISVDPRSNFRPEKLYQITSEEIRR
ncbi:MAG TPA: hypothetical protein VJ020_10960, partial [Anaerolineales bacterium]|nr:hypothetical protein [Anaerolineales bacterium]